MLIPKPFDEERYLHPYLACDLFELMITAGLVEEFSSADIRSFLRNSGISDSDLCEIAGKIQGTFPDEDAVESLISSYFTRFKKRKREYGAAYPFSVKSSSIRRNEACPPFTLYDAMVVLSRMDTLDASTRTNLSLEFESIACVCLSELLGSSFKVHHVGTGGGGSSHIFSKNKKKRLRRLARWLNYSIDEEHMDDVSDTGGDHGVDLFARLRVDRRTKGALIIIGQCAASNNPDYWKKKIGDGIKTEEVIVFPFSPQHALIIPVEYRRADWRWENITGLKRVLLFDRFRLKGYLHQIAGSNISTKLLALRTQLEELLAV